MSTFFDLYGTRLINAIGTHFVYVTVSVLFGFLIALTLGILLSRAPGLSRIVLPILSVFQTIPGIVFIGLLFLYIGMVPITAITALGIYAVFPILKNTYVGIIEVPQDYKDAAKGCGMTSFQTLVEVEIPMALPFILSGLRMSTVYTVSWAVLAAMIGLGGLGEIIYAGIMSNNNTLILGGAIPCALMAIVYSQLVDGLRRLLIPKALRRATK